MSVPPDSPNPDQLIADLQRQLSERTAERDEALARETAASEILQVISQSPTDVQPVLDVIAERAVKLCEGESCAVFRYDGTLQYFAAFSRNTWSDVSPDEIRASYPRALNRHFPTGLAMLDRTVVHTENIRTDDRFLFGANHVTAKFQAALAVPMMRDDQVIGAIAVTRMEAKAFTERQIELLKMFAAQAVIAMENARLLGELRERTDQVAGLNRGLEARVAEQVEELGRVGRLKRFLAPQLAEMIVSQGDEKILESHRREIVVVFCDLRGYTAFAETAEPEEVLDFLREYHGALGPLVSQFEGTLDQFSGDGIMVFFNDPVPISDPAERAVKMAIAMREAAASLTAAWRERGRELGFGAGIAQGYATLGQIGFSERSGYTAIGTVCNVAARLCGEAKDGQILLSQRVNVALNGSVATEQVGALTLKGLTQPVVVHNVPLTTSQPALRVIDAGNH